MNTERKATHQTNLSRKVFETAKMWTLSLICVAFLVLISCCPVSSQRKPTIKIAKAWHAVVALRSTSTLRVLKTGAVIRWTKGKRIRVLTCAHASHLAMVILKPRRVVLFLTKFAPQHDLAVFESLKPATETRHSLQLARYAPFVSQRVSAIGYSLGRYKRFVRGSIAAIVKFGSLWTVSTDADLIYGNSGSPLLNKEGRIVGIVARLKGYQGYIDVLAIHLKHIRALLK